MEARYDTTLKKWIITKGAPTMPTQQEPDTQESTQSDGWFSSMLVQALHGGSEEIKDKTTKNTAYYDSDLKKWVFQD